ncbi:hypothetical protein RclHR1_24570002 [Rhizophagus clarus]|uniref:BZIP domain-containing protein n=1 Tax=Rhizophagus clarus TaxID=94130 RepID=A0A2Z6RS67_9GLOM|nr:hypothetical protein RclHR1_24570002 [Rhizophagus clarus]GES93111.1 hypothetical protein GLOIN_2v1551536 [Rhizophagus clarus]
MKYNLKGSKGHPTNILSYNVKEKQAVPTTLEQIVTCQTTLPAYPTNSPYCTEHRLLNAPLLRKHLENLKRYRAVRRKAREDYVNALETKAHKLELLYTITQEDIKILTEKLVLLEGRLAKVQRNHNDDNNASSVKQSESSSVISNGLSSSNNHGEGNNDAIV